MTVSIFGAWVVNCPQGEARLCFVCARKQWKQPKCAVCAMFTLSCLHFHPSLLSLFSAYSGLHTPSTYWVLLLLLIFHVLVVLLLLTLFSPKWPTLVSVLFVLLFFSCCCCCVCDEFRRMTIVACESVWVRVCVCGSLSECVRYRDSDSLKWLFVSTHRLSGQ